MKNQTIEAVSSPASSIAVLGSGLGALVDAVSFAGRNCSVRMLVPDANASDRLRQGCADFAEPGLTQQLVAAQSDARLTFVAGLHRALHASDVSLLWFDEKPGNTMAAQVAALQAVAEELAGFERFHLVVVRSLLAPGTMDRLVLPLLERVSGKRCGEDFGLCYCPEVVRPGVALADFRNPVRMLVGAEDDTSADAIASAFRWRVGQLCIQSFLTAETARVADLLWQVAKLRFKEELGHLCRQTGASRRGVLEAFKGDTKQNISACYLIPGCPQPEVLDEQVEALLEAWCAGDGSFRQANGLQLVSA